MEGNHGTFTDSQTTAGCVGEAPLDPPAPVELSGDCGPESEPKKASSTTAQTATPQNGEKQPTPRCFKLLSFGVICHPAARVEIIVNTVKMKVLC